MSGDQVVITDVRYTLEGTQFVLEIGGEEHVVSLPVFGGHAEGEVLAHVQRELAAGAAPARALETLTVQDIPHHRRRRESTSGAIIIDDTSSQRLDEMRGALQLLAQLGRLGRQTIVVLGGLQLDPPPEPDARDELGLLLVRLDIAQLVAIGPELRRLHLSAGREGSWNGESVHVDDPAQAYDFLSASMEGESVILVCGGSNPALDDLVTTLCEAPA